MGTRCSPRAHHGSTAIPIALLAAVVACGWFLSPCLHFCLPPLITIPALFQVRPPDVSVNSALCVQLRASVPVFIDPRVQQEQRALTFAVPICLWYL